VCVNIHYAHTHTRTIIFIHKFTYIYKIVQNRNRNFATICTTYVDNAGQYAAKLLTNTTRIYCLYLPISYIYATILCMKTVLCLCGWLLYTIWRMFNIVIVESFLFYIILSIVFSIRLMKGKFWRLSFSLHQIIDSFSPTVQCTCEDQIKTKVMMFLFFFHSKIIL